VKIIHHPRHLEELSRKIEIEKFNLEISQKILQEKDRSVRELAKKIYVISFSMFMIGLMTGIVMVVAIKDLF